MTLQQRIAQIEEEKRKREQELEDEDVLPPELKTPNSSCFIQSGLRRRNVQIAIRDKRYIGEQNESI